MFFIGNLFAFTHRPRFKWIGLVSLLSISKSLASLCYYAVCNYAPNERKNIPVLVENDYLYWAGSALSTFLSGYLVSLLIIYTPSQIRKKYSSQTVLVKFLKYKQIETEKAGLAGVLTSVILVVGILSGLQMTKLFQLCILYF